MGLSIAQTTDFTNMRVRDISIADIAAGKVWRVRPPPEQEPYPDLVDLEIEPGVDLREEDDVAYSALAVIPAEGRVRATLLIREVGTYEWWGDMCEWVDGAWRDGLSPEWCDGELWVASPSALDPSFMGEETHEVHRAGFARWRDLVARGEVS